MRASPGNGRFTGKVAVVTGGARNVGLGIARAFAAEGAAVLIAARSADAGEAAAEAIGAEGGTAAFHRTDVAEPDQAQAMVEAAVEHFGGLHVLVNNAAVMEHATHGGRLADLSVEHWDDYVRTNITGPFLCTKFAIPAIVASGGGAIVNISSLAAYSARREGGGYGISKSALGALTRYTAVDHAPDVRCNELVLGAIQKESPIYDVLASDPEIGAQMRRIDHLGRLGRPADVAAACLFLCSEESGWITGAELRVDGGAHITSPMPDWSRVRAILTQTGAW